MNCQRTSSLLSAYLDRELTGEEMLLIRGHLARCPACEDEREALQMVKRLLGALPQTDPDADWAAALTDNAVIAGQSSQWDRLRVLLGDLERRLLADDAGVVRGRRLARSLALSALALFLVAAPFAQRETPVQTGGMGPTGLDLRPAWQPPMVHPMMTPMPTPVPIGVTHTFSTNDLNAPSMQLTSLNRFSSAPPMHLRWEAAPWITTNGNYLTFSNLER